MSGSPVERDGGQAAVGGDPGEVALPCELRGRELVREAEKPAGLVLVVTAIVVGCGLGMMEQVG
ncbi:hypothetical protein [Salinispora arenicola]|uniref:hypothetical protein n=1 Tax=Salinispora arenicola TaxID=168697 RepID=UPI0002E95B5B|nr:hypothetical protein [Salinispora arenicola]MCN0178494.1 hypothetical protein [Salinispora arenicola]